MCKIANYPKKISDSWLFVVRTEKVRLFFIFRAYKMKMVFLPMMDSLLKDLRQEYFNLKRELAQNVYE